MSNAKNVRTGYCGKCYAEGIARLCTGFTIAKPRGRAPVAVPPLDPVMRTAVRRAAAAYLEENGAGDALRHPHHARELVAS